MCDGEELGPGELVYAKSQVKGEAFALKSPTLLLIVGGVPGEPYGPPQ